jgi:malto-oligosyltrehalose trehalohydrolase
VLYRARFDRLVAIGAFGAGASSHCERQDSRAVVDIRGARGFDPSGCAQYVLPDSARVADPASHFQPEGVRGPSELIDARAYRWRVDDWKGRSWSTAVLYQLHVGTFTRSGTFAGVIDKLDHLVELGITALQLMPIGAFAGRRNWGYEGVFPYACHVDYGRPDDLKRLIDEAHARGLMVLLDVVYNHFGPEGNLLAQYAPQFFTERHKTPWDAAINFDGSRSRAVRDFFSVSGGPVQH